jgi:hypothetical protein
VEHGLPVTTAAVIKDLARRLAGEAGRQQVERQDVCQALGQHFGAGEDDDPEE